MFKKESEMIPVLRRQLSEKYRTNYCINEFDSGNGIADLVFAQGVDFNAQNQRILNYELIYLMIKHLNRKNRLVERKKFFENSTSSRKHILNLLSSLIELGIIEKTDDGNFIVRSKYSPPVKKIISIEAKLYDWKGGFYQALRYKAYSHKSYLAISEDFLHRVDIDLLKNHGIGLISVSPERVRFVLNVKGEAPNNKVAHAYLAQKIAHSCSVIGLAGLTQIQ